jgi:hypothetical protein
LSYDSSSSLLAPSLFTGTQINCATCLSRERASIAPGTSLSSSLPHARSQACVLEAAFEIASLGCSLRLKARVTPSLCQITPCHYSRLGASRLLVAMKVALGLVGSSTSGDGLRPHLRLPAPPPSPFVKYPSPPSEDKTRAPPAPPVAAHKLIRLLLSARSEAERALMKYRRTADLPQEHP